MNAQNLIRKYNVPGPRYTSYPTVPFWKNKTLSENEWKQEITRFKNSYKHEEISLYIHLPYCESLCTFCGCHKRITKNHNVEEPYIDTLLKEWQLYVNSFDFVPKIKELHFGGGTPTFFQPTQLIRLLSDIFKTNQILPEQCDLSFEAHPNSTTESHLKELFDFGFRRVSFGIQDYDIKVQRAIHRIQSFQDVKKVHELSKEIGFESINHDLVYGLPLQNMKGFMDTIDMTIELKPERIALYSYAHVPWIKGTGQRGFSESDLPQDAIKRELYEKSCEKLIEAGYISIGMDHFALPEDSLAIALKNKELHRNFMGYTTKATNWMIGLGMSAISDCWTGFAQNEKTIEAYQEKINKGELAVFRGHLLSEIELEIRRYILDIMCHFETTFDEKSNYKEIHQQIKERLIPLQKDSLVAFEENTVRVLNQGLPFVRNICMAFDLDLFENQQSDNLFSKTI